MTASDVNKPKPMRRIRCIMDVTPRVDLHFPDGRLIPPSGIILTYNLESFQSIFNGTDSARVEPRNSSRDESKLVASTTIDKREGVAPVIGGVADRQKM